MAQLVFLLRRTASSHVRLCRYLNRCESERKALRAAQAEQLAAQAAAAEADAARSRGATPGAPESRSEPGAATGAAESESQRQLTPGSSSADLTTPLATEGGAGTEAGAGAGAGAGASDHSPDGRYSHGSSSAGSEGAKFKEHVLTAKQ